MPQAQLGSFVFQLGAAEFGRIQRTDAFRWASRERLGRMPVRQWLGPKAPTLLLEGVILVEHPSQLDAPASLRGQAGGATTENEPLDLFLGGAGRRSGDYLGAWVVDEMSETRTILNRDATPARMEFQMRLSYHDG